MPGRDVVDRVQLHPQREEARAAWVDPSNAEPAVAGPKGSEPAMSGPRCWASEGCPATVHPAGGPGRGTKITGVDRGLLGQRNNVRSTPDSDP